MNENITEIKKTGTTNAQAKKIKILIQKQKKLIKTQEKLANFKEPCILLLRNTGKAEWHEEATKGDWEYTHSDGGKRFIVLNKEGLSQIEYAERTINTYICHEDYPLPLKLMFNPIVATDIMTQHHEKTVNEFSELSKGMSNEQRKKIMTYAKAIAIIVLVVIVAMQADNIMRIIGGLFGVDLTPVVDTTVQTVKQNISEVQQIIVPSV